jgi:CysZ protein
MRFIEQFVRGVTNCISGFKILFSSGFKRFMLYPLLVWLIFWTISIAGSFALAGSITDQLSALIEFSELPDLFPWIQNLGPYLKGIFTFLLKLFIQFLFFMLGGTLVKYIVLILLSPVFSILSEKADARLSGKSFPFSFRQFLNDILRGILISLRNMLLEYGVIFACFFTTLLAPPLVALTAPLTLLAAWYFTGFTLMDYNCERYRYSLRQSVTLLRNNKGYVCGTGFVYSVFLALPFMAGSLIGLVLGPAIAVIGGTISFSEIRRDAVLRT